MSPAALVLLRGGLRQSLKLVKQPLDLSFIASGVLLHLKPVTGFHNSQDWKSSDSTQFGGAVYLSWSSCGRSVEA